MWHLPKCGSHLRIFAALFCLSLITACGGGGAEEVVVESPSPVAWLAIDLTRVGPNAVQVDWSDDPYVASFIVSRDGYDLAIINSLSFIDAAVMIDQSYCYDVSGYDSFGMLVALSDIACLTVVP